MTSLEQALIDNTAALRELVAIWTRRAATYAAATPPAADDVQKTDATAEAPAAPAKPAKAKPAPAAQDVQKMDAPAHAAAPAIDYAQVGPAITAYAAAHGRQATLDKLASFGVKSGKELKPEQYAAALAAFKVEA